MPRGDGTGPMGLGPMTGRGAGFCAGFGMPGFMNPFGYRMGLGWRRGAWGIGGGHGWRNMYYATGLPGWARAGYAPAGSARPAYEAPTAAREQEVEALRAQAEQLKTQLEAIARRIEELETASA
ncbi:MAG: DUF5320 domain-containing protein [Chloroflexi bacterium]|nr:DUF5320 domain-containing protein [Chloroflexota bacterium]